MNPTQCFENCSSGVVQIFLEKNGQKIGSGSGFLVNGGVVTNNHVVRSANFDAIAIRFADDNPENQGSYIRVGLNDVIAAESPENEEDFAYLNMNEPEFENKYVFSFSDNEDIKVGQEVGFLGYPFGMFNLTCHRGNISSIYSKNNVLVYQIDGSVNGGNSGGPLVSLETGNVIGIVTRAQTGLIEDQINNLIQTLQANQQALTQAKILMSIGGFDPVQGFIASQAAMEVIAKNIKRSANVGIGYAFSSQYVDGAIQNI